MTEPAVASSDARNIETSIVRDGDEYIINGRKWWITGVADERCQIFIVMGKTEPGAGSYRQQSMILVPRDTPGVTIVRHLPIFGYQDQHGHSEIVFDDVRVPEANLLGPRGAGFRQCLEILDGGRISIAALSLGMAEGAFAAALKYSKERQQFGKAISEFQAIQWKLADMATEIEAAKLLTLRAAAMKDAGMKTTLESSMAKLYASEVAVRCANEGVQIHGGYGFIKDYPAEKFYRDVKLCTIGEGTSEIQRLVIARQLLKD